MKGYQGWQRLVVSGLNQQSCFWFENQQKKGAYMWDLGL